MIEKTGYRRRTFDEIVNAKFSSARNLFGEEINLNGNTALGKFILINAYDQYRIEEIAEQLYYSLFPQTAYGQSLDRLGWSIGMTRNDATPASYKVKVRGTAGAVVEKGFLVGVNLDYVGEDGDLTFYNTQEVVIGEAEEGELGECEIVVTCTTAGLIGNVSPSTIDRIVNPNATIEAVKGVSVVEAATDEESDYEFRKRFEIVREGKGSCTAASIISALVDIPTVQSAYVNVNESATETVNGIPPKTIACYVDGGANYSKEIAEAIFDKKPVGIGTYGNNSVELSYGGMSGYKVNYSYAESVNVYIKLTLTTNAKFQADGNATIKANISEFIGNLGMGGQLVTTALYGEIYKVAGVVTAIIETSTNGETFAADNIAVEPYERCVLNTLTINGSIV